MDFFGHQDKARRATKGLVWLFVAAVACIITLIYIAAKALLITTKNGNPNIVDWPVLGIVAASVIVVIGAAMLFKSSQLRSGGSTVARMLGGRLVEIDTKDPKERVLRNVVEEMAIASGMPVPDVFVMDGEQGINAFAAGWSPQDAAIAVTRGSLDSFTRDELQGVIAHEFSHVFNGDMRLNIRLMGTLFGIIFIAVIGRIIMRGAFYSGASRRSSNNKNNALPILIFGVALIVIGGVGVLFARMIQAAVSRQREYLADASAVQYTRNPRGIGMALAKIGGLGSQLKSAHAEEASHMMFANGVSRLGGAMATHPPLTDRIERVLPGFLKNSRGADSLVSAVSQTPAPQGTAGFAGTAGVASATGKAAAARKPRRTTSKDLLETTGNLQTHNIEAARSLLDATPLDIVIAAQEATRAPALIFALLLDSNPAMRAKQLDLLKQAPHSRSDELIHHASDHYRDIAKLDQKFRLPILELATPALRALTPKEREQLMRDIRSLATADNKITPFEFALIKSLDRHLQKHGQVAAQPRGRMRSLTSCAEQTATVLSVIAHAGATNDEGAAEAAFAKGRDLLGQSNMKLMPATQSQPENLDSAIEDLANVSPLAKRNLLTACAEVAAADGHLAADEIDLIRVLGELWDCPIPLTQLAD